MIWYFHWVSIQSYSFSSSWEQYLPGITSEEIRDHFLRFPPTNVIIRNLKKFQNAYSRSAKEEESWFGTIIVAITLAEVARRKSRHCEVELQQTVLLFLMAAAVLEADGFKSRKFCGQAALVKELKSWMFKRLSCCVVTSGLSDRARAPPEQSMWGTICFWVLIRIFDFREGNAVFSCLLVKIIVVPTAAFKCFVRQSLASPVCSMMNGVVFLLLLRSLGGLFVPSALDVSLVTQGCTIGWWNGGGFYFFTLVFIVLESPPSNSFEEHVASKINWTVPTKMFFFILQKRQRSEKNNRPVLIALRFLLLDKVLFPGCGLMSKVEFFPHPFILSIYTAKMGIVVSCVEKECISNDSLIAISSSSCTLNREESRWNQR